MDLKLSESDRRYWAQCGMPDPICDLLVNAVRSKSRQADRLLARARRLLKYWLSENTSDEDRIKFERAWTSISKSLPSAPQPDGVIYTPPLPPPIDLAAFFALWPDGPTRQPYSGVTGTRRRGALDLSPADERKAYERLAESAREVEEFLAGDRAKRFRWLLSDATLTIERLSAEAGESVDVAERRRKEGRSHRLRSNLRQLHDRFSELRLGLASLRSVLMAVDPASKYPTAHADSGMSIYIALLGQLNGRLDKPQPSAIARIATANCPEYPVKPDAIRKATVRGQT